MSNNNNDKLLDAILKEVYAQVRSLRRERDFQQQLIKSIAQTAVIECHKWRTIEDCIEEHALEIGVNDGR